MAKPVQLDTSLCEYTYTVARQAPLSIRRQLPEKLFKAINTEKGAMRFALRSTFEQKREFFAYMGIDQYLIFVDRKGDEIDDPRKIFSDINKDDKPSNVLKKLGEDNAYVSGNKEFCFLLGLTSQTVDTKGYVRNAELMRTSYHVKNFKNKISIPEYDEANEAKSSAQEVMKFIHGVLWATDTCKDVTGVELNSVRILIYFYMNRHSYLSHENLMGAFAGTMSNQQIEANRRVLSANLLIQRHPSQKRKEYTITGRGILVVNQFRDKVMKSFYF